MIAYFEVVCHSRFISYIWTTTIWFGGILMVFWWYLNNIFHCILMIFWGVYTIATTSPIRTTTITSVWGQVTVSEIIFNPSCLWDELCFCCPFSTTFKLSQSSKHHQDSLSSTFRWTRKEVKEDDFQGNFKHYNVIFRAILSTTTKKEFVTFISA